MKFVIVESPTKAKTIKKYLGKDYEVESSMGHVRDLPKSSLGIDVEHDFEPEYVIPEKKMEKVEQLRAIARKADEVVLATDPDREGEAIAWHLVEALDLDKQKAPVQRIVFHEITEPAILAAMQEPREIDEHLLRAQEARRVLDRIVGYDLSELIWKKVRYGLSAGRVQSPALRIIVEREREIRDFDPETYWVIRADVRGDGEEFQLVCVEEPRDEKLVEKILAQGKTETWVVVSIDESNHTRRPRAPFKTSTLQQAASSRLGFSPSRTMRIAQQLYEAGLITYMRTDSLTISKQAQKDAAEEIEERYGKEYVEAHQYKTKSKAAQEAHEAIRPTNLRVPTAGKDVAQRKLYELIWKRAISSQMKPAKIVRTKMLVRVGKGEVPDFSINGSRTLFDGWLRAFPEARGEDVELPKLKEGDSLTLSDIEAEEKQTQPPNRYSEAGLIKEMEKRGIGRPSTYATIIRTLEKRGYVTRENRTLHPTDTGEVVSDFLEKNFERYVSDSFTSEMEDNLDEIADGKREYTDTLRTFYKQFTEDLDAKKDIPKITTLGDVPEEYPCPVCGAPMVYKLGRNGIFMSCSRFPDCKGARMRNGDVIDDDKPIGKHPETGEDIYVLQGPYGPYVQLGEKEKGKKKPKRASIPKDKEPSDVTIEDAVKYLSLPRTLGEHPESGKEIKASIGRFGPYIVHDGDFRSLKEDDVYAVGLERALEILAQPKRRRGGKKKAAKKSAKKSTQKSTKGGSASGGKKKAKKSPKPKESKEDKK